MQFNSTKYDDAILVLKEDLKAEIKKIKNNYAETVKNYKAVQASAYDQETDLKKDSNDAVDTAQTKVAIKNKIDVAYTKYDEGLKYEDLYSIGKIELDKKLEEVKTVLSGFESDYNKFIEFLKSRKLYMAKSGVELRNSFFDAMSEFSEYNVTLDTGAITEFLKLLEDLNLLDLTTLSNHTPYTRALDKVGDKQRSYVEGVALKAQDKIKSLERWVKKKWELAIFGVTAIRVTYDSDRKLQFVITKAKDILSALYVEDTKTKLTQMLDAASSHNQTISRLNTEIITDPGYLEKPDTLLGEYAPSHSSDSVSVERENAKKVLKELLKNYKDPEIGGASEEEVEELLGKSKKLNLPDWMYILDKVYAGGEWALKTLGQTTTVLPKEVSIDEDFEHSIDYDFELSYPMPVPPSPLVTRVGFVFGFGFSFSGSVSGSLKLHNFLLSKGDTTEEDETYNGEYVSGSLKAETEISATVGGGISVIWLVIIEITAKVEFGPKVSANIESSVTIGESDLNKALADFTLTGGAGIELSLEGTISLTVTLTSFIRALLKALSIKIPKKKYALTATFVKATRANAITLKLPFTTIDPSSSIRLSTVKLDNNRNEWTIEYPAWESIGNLVKTKILKSKKKPEILRKQAEIFIKADPLTDEQVEQLKLKYLKEFQAEN